MTNNQMILENVQLRQALAGAAAVLEHGAMRLRILGDDQSSKVLAAKAKAALAACAQ